MGIERERQRKKDEGGDMSPARRVRVTLGSVEHFVPSRGKEIRTESPPSSRQIVLLSSLSDMLVGRASQKAE